MRTIELLLSAGTLLCAAGALAALAWRRRRRALAPALARIAHAIPEGLGDALLVLDGEGRIVDANDAAVALAGRPLLGRAVAELGPDLAVLARGLSRGPASARVSLSPLGARARASAALVRISTRPVRDLVVLRPDPAERPPPLPPRAAPGAVHAASPEEIVDARAVVAAAAAAVREPLARAARAASLLRLSAPALSGRADAALGELERAVDEAVRRGAALAAAGHAGPRHAVDLAALVEDLAAALALPRGVALRVRAGAARADVDDRPLRSALREVLRCAAAALPAGGELVVGVAARPGGALVEIGLGGAAPYAATALARALLAPQGARVEEEAARRPGGPLLRIVLPAAAADATSPVPPP